MKRSKDPRFVALRVKVDIQRRLAVVGARLIAEHGKTVGYGAVIESLLDEQYPETKLQEDARCHQ